MSDISQSRRTDRDEAIDRRHFLKTGVLAATAIGLNNGTGRAANKKQYPSLGDASQLFVDDELIEPLENVQRVFHQAEKHSANPVIRKQKPWETLYGTWGTVLYDETEKVFKAWYGGQGRSTGIDKPGFQKKRHVLCHATSTDGVHWDRPELGLHAFEGSKQNNIVIGDEYHLGMDHWESILKDPLDTDPKRRYKAVGWSSYDWDGPLSGIYSMTSPDGLNWTHTPEPVFRYHPRPGTADLGPVGDAQSMMIDTLRGRYVAFLRTIPHRAMSVSTDFIKWTPPKRCLEARAEETSNMVYNHVGFVYGDRYLGFLTYFDRDPQDPLCTVRLLSSRDGESWQRPTDEPFIDVGPIGEPDRFLNMLTGGSPIRVGNRLYIYYRSLAVRHNPYEGDDDTGGRYPGGISLATLRVDGFASLGASYDGGRVTTKPFRFSGSRLTVNAKADFGRLHVEALTESGEPISGFSFDDCRPIAADGLNESVTWMNHTTLKTLKGQPIRLRFRLENARIYSFRIA